MKDFEFLDSLKQLSPEALERFKRVVSRLFSGEVVSPGADSLATDVDWRFIERHLEVVRGYLRVAGWEVEHLPAYRAYRAVHAGGAHKVQISLLESMILCVLRQAYHTHMAATTSGERRCEVETGELRERLAQARRTSRPDTRRKLASALVRLQRLGLVEVPPGYRAEDPETIVVLPLVETVLSMEKVQAFWADYQRERSSTPEGVVEALEDEENEFEDDSEAEEAVLAEEV